MTKLIESALAHAWPVQWYDELDSTNAEAKRRASTGEFGPCWIAARKQINGKGRLGRPWQAPEGNLSATALFPFDGSFDQISKLSFLAGLAIYDAALLEGVPASKLQLKWPNDVRCERHKFSGVLIETGQVSKDLSWVALGVGVNILRAPDIDQPTVCLKDLSANAIVNADNFLDRLKVTFGNRLHSLIKFGFEPIRQDWLANAEGYNHSISVKDSQSTMTGIMRGINETGALMLEMGDGTIKLVTTGDVNLVG